MKRAVLLPVLVALLLSLSASAARAVPLLSLTMMDLTPGCALSYTNCTLTVGETVPGTIVSSAPVQVGRFDVSSYFGMNLSGMVVPIETTLQLAVSSSTSGKFEAILSQTGLQLVGKGQANVYSDFGLFGGTANFASWIDSSPPLSTGAVFNLPSGPFSLYSKVDTVFTAPGNVIANTDVQIIPVSTPEPGTMMLFGAGALGLALVGSRRSKKDKQVVERCVVMKKAALLPVLVALLLSFSASVARATPVFILTMQDVGGGTTVTVNDNGPGDMDLAVNQIIYNGKVGAFDVTFTTGSVLADPGPGVLAQMFLHSFLVTTKLDGVHFLATLFASDVSSTLLPTLAQASVSSSVVFNGVTGNVILTQSVDPNNGIFPPPPASASTVTQVTSTTVNNLPGLSAPFALAGNFSLFSTIDMTFGTRGSVTADTGLKVIPTATPEPGTMMLFGSGVLGLVSLGRRRSKKGTVSNV